jgi:hypothetical protein
MLTYPCFNFFRSYLTFTAHPFIPLLTPQIHPLNTPNPSISYQTPQRICSPVVKTPTHNTLTARVKSSQSLLRVSKQHVFTARFLLCRYVSESSKQSVRSTNLIRVSGGGWWFGRGVYVGDARLNRAGSDVLFLLAFEMGSGHMGLAVEEFACVFCSCELDID